jgi:hypothetical protein
MWDSWWTKWNDSRFISEYLGIPMSILIPPILHCVIFHKGHLTADYPAAIITRDSVQPNFKNKKNDSAAYLIVIS